MPAALPGRSGPRRRRRLLLLCAGWLLAAACLAGAGAGAGAGCRHRCCPGRNNECWAAGGGRARCYCDEYCEKTGDCCEDYGAVCRRAALDCVVGPWGPWGGCSSRCGAGSTARTRHVAVPPRPGGRPCPDLRQRRGCLGDDALCRTAKEVAMILPDSFKRRPGDAAAPRADAPPSYCGFFRLKQVGAACRRGAWSSRLRREQRVCVECRGAAGSSPRCGGDGLPGARTFWTAAAVAGCQGSWVREALRERCACPRRSLLFV
ncbi:somatomedin-B and thrombospondin type-1 domain-containing protein-like [Dromaius novaehollandiae]|uniref:somatomedin-B and thrombospondin type-1 domain-containing protein-like n=1 Tax=Dromaius novaehollandiae TaxID=8790 RepID=UPI00311E0DDC